MSAEDHTSSPTPKRRVRRWEWVGLGGLGIAVALVLSLTAFDHEADVPDVRDAAPVVNPYEDGRRAGAQAVLDEWARAVRSGDTAALPGLFDSAAAPGFLDAEIRRAQNASQVPFSEFGYDIGLDREVPVGSAVADELGASDVRAPTVYLRYAIAGADAQPTRKPVALLLARRGDEWKLVSDSGVPGSDRETWRGPWDFGPIITRVVPGEEGRSSIVLGHPGSRRWSIVSPASSATRSLTSPTHGARTGPVGPSCWSPVPRRSSRRWSAPRTAAPTSLPSPSRTRLTCGHGPRPVSGSCSARGRRPTDGPHPGVGAAPRADTHRRPHGHPGRVAAVDPQGYADYVGYRGIEATFGALAPTLAASVAAHGPPTALPTDADFGAGGDTARRAYESSWSLAAFVASEYGEERLDSLYRALAQGRASADQLDERIRGALGVGTDALVQGWGTWVEKQLA
ncbi:hypothetical protein P9209_15195 [Prescottella defluvii]|nr:hypothetical protein P9209_15195 [Prescottella defluvii]